MTTLRPSKTWTTVTHRQSRGDMHWDKLPVRAKETVPEWNIERL